MTLYSSKPFGNRHLHRSTNRDLKQMVANGTFREDLYYRINRTRPCGAAGAVVWKVLPSQRGVRSFLTKISPAILFIPGCELKAHGVEYRPTNLSSSIIVITAGAGVQPLGYFLTKGVKKSHILSFQALAASAPQIRIFRFLPFHLRRAPAIIRRATSSAIYEKLDYRFLFCEYSYNHRVLIKMRNQL